MYLIMFIIVCIRCAFNIIVSLKYSIFMYIYIVMYMLTNVEYMCICSFIINDYFVVTGGTASTWN